AESNDSRNDYSESNVSKNNEDDNDPLPEFSKESEDSGDEYLNNNGSENDESDEQDSTTSENDEDSSNIGTDTLSLFLEDDFDEKSSISKKSYKGKFKQISSIEEEMNIDQPLEETLPFDVYKQSDDDEIMTIPEEEPDDSPSSSSSSNDSTDSASESSTDSQEHKPINFILPEIDPKIFD
ncbi:8898_t:CDS:1, partial [Ambispora leptoticha]